ncbi:MAG TPA: DUF481 domain-containing protein [Phycisphaerales bacterium]|nr:DUF481 domain-containing protein [Phycisphaerales bacterium]
MTRPRRTVSATALLAAAAASGSVALADVPAQPPVAAPVPAVVAGADGPLARITLTNGDTFHAAIVSDSDPLVLDHPLIGRMSIARERIRSVVKDDPAPGPPPVSAEAAPVAPAAAADAQVAAPMPPAPPKPPPPPSPQPQLPVAPPPEPSFADLWKFTLEAGLNGTTGANQTQSFRTLITGNRPTPEMSTTASVGWWYSRTNDQTTAQRVQVDARNEWPATAKSTWSYFVSGRSEYDEFQRWDWRLSATGGVGLKIIGDEKLTITGRTGFGGSREFGRSRPEVRAEFSPSMEIEYKINARNKLGAAAAAWVDVEDADASRANLKAWYEAVLDPDHGMSLKLGVEDRYEHSPGFGREKHEVDYYAVIVFNF